MKNNKCTKYFPKQYVSETVFDDGISGYPKYKRRVNLRHVYKRCSNKSTPAKLDNRHVVPYKRGLLLKYQCHMNVEVYSTVKAAKYI